MEPRLMYENVVEIRPAHAAFALPTGQSLNAASPDPSKHVYYDPSAVVYVLYKLNERRTRATRVLTSFHPQDGWRIGTVLGLYHDDTRAYLGEYKIVGVKDFRNGEQAGDVPDISIKHAVMK
jgi:hypothetical protein